MIRTLLILGGTAEARALAAAATARFPDIRVISSLAGRTIAPRMPVGEVYCGGFGGAGGMAQYIRAENVDAVIDATHPFAEEISRNAAQATERAGVPRMVLMRRPWNFVQPDKVQHFRSINAVVAELQGRGERIFLAIGRQEVNQFNELTDRFFLLRFIDAPQTPPLFADCHVLTGRPGGYDDERRMLQQALCELLLGDEEPLGPCLLDGAPDSAGTSDSAGAAVSVSASASSCSVLSSCVSFLNSFFE